MDEVREAVADLRAGLYYATETWPDEELWRRLLNKLDDLEDDVAKRIQSLEARNARNDGLQNVIRSRAAHIVREILKYDEESHRIAPAPRARLVRAANWLREKARAPRSTPNAPGHQR